MPRRAVPRRSVVHRTSRRRAVQGCPRTPVRGFDAGVSVRSPGTAPDGRRAVAARGAWHGQGALGGTGRVGAGPAGPGCRDAARGQIGPRTDLWAAGVVAYRCRRQPEREERTPSGGMHIPHQAGRSREQTPPPRRPGTSVPRRRGGPGSTGSPAHRLAAERI